MRKGLYNRSSEAILRSHQRNIAHNTLPYIDEKLRSLLERAKCGSYVAPPVRRVHIPKAGDGSQTKPIGIPLSQR